MPILAANLILDDEPELAELNIQKSVILQVGKTKIGVIGYLTPETKFLAPKNKVEYESEITAIRREIEILKKEKVNILIALGHSGYIEDINIAKNVEDLDLVIGGHSNTFLWNGNTTEKPEYPEGLYPTIVTQASGRKVLVVQAYAYTKYIGQLHLLFNSMGEIITFQGQPLLLDHRVPEDPELLEKVEQYSKAVGELYNENIGESLSLLNGTCRLYECNIGTLVTDAILNYTKKYYPEYTDVNIAVIQGGRIRASIDHVEKPFKITRGEVMTVLPFTDMLTVVTMNGTLLKQALEHSVSTWRLIDSTGQFLQVSGIKVTYDLARPPGSRVTEVKAVCSDYGHNELSEVEDTCTYKMLMPSFLADGGDGYKIFVHLPKDVVPFNEIDCVMDYIKQYSPINVVTDGRIKIFTSKETIAQPRAANNKGSSTIPFALPVILCLYKLFA